MNRVDSLAAALTEAFTLILNERMAGIPILNNRLGVEAVEFQLYQGRPFGVIITPWLMNLIIGAGEDENWSDLTTGDIRSYDFPAGRRDFLVNEIEGAGVVQSHSLYSPMSRFVNQDHARAAARKCLVDLMTELDPDEHLDEARLKQFIDGGEMPADEQTAEVAGAGPEAGDEGADKPATRIARSDLLRGNFSGKS